MKNIRVLFIGNSHTYMNDMPQLFKTVYEKTTGGSAEVTMQAFSGRHLDWHLDEYLSLRFALLYGGFDFCVIQQAAHPFPPEEETLPAGKRLMEMCAAAGVMPVLYMTWAEKRMPENQQKMIDTYTRLYAMGRSLLAPVGVIWQAMRADHPEVELYYHDGEHASPCGDLLIAAVLTATISGQTDVSLPDEMIDFKVATKNRGDMSLCMSRESVRVPVDQNAAAAILEEIDRHAALFQRP